MLHLMIHMWDLLSYNASLNLYFLISLIICSLIASIGWSITMSYLQVHMDMSVSAPFLVLNENKMMMLLPLTLLHREAPDPGNTASWTEVPNVPMKIEFPLEKWIHVGCEVIFLPWSCHENWSIDYKFAIYLTTFTLFCSNTFFPAHFFFP